MSNPVTQEMLPLTMALGFLTVFDPVCKVKSTYLELHGTFIVFSAQRMIHPCIFPILQMCIQHGKVYIM